MLIRMCIKLHILNFCIVIILWCNIETTNLNTLHGMYQALVFILDFFATQEKKHEILLFLKILTTIFHQKTKPSYLKLCIS